MPWNRAVKDNPAGALFALKTAGLDEEGYPMFQDKDVLKFHS